MQIEYKTFESMIGVSRDFHVLTYAEIGFSPLDIYARQNDISQKVLVEFADSVNRKEEMESLIPLAPISAIPRSAIREKGDPLIIAEYVSAFLVRNQQTFKAKKLLFDFRVPHLMPLVRAGIRIALDEFSSADIDEAVILCDEKYLQELKARALQFNNWQGMSEEDEAVPNPLLHEVIQQIIGFAEENLPSSAYITYVGQMAPDLLRALNDMPLHMGWWIRVRGFYRHLPAAPESYPYLKFITGGEGTLASDLMIHDVAWTGGYRIERITAEFPPKLMVLLGEGIDGALIDKYLWDIRDGVAFGKLKDPKAKWWFERSANLQ